jgi:cytochrome c553
MKRAAMLDFPRFITPAFITLLLAVPILADQPKDEAVLFFEKKIRPLLASNCYNCHSADTNSKGGLRVDDRNGLVHGGNSGPAVVPGHPEQSRLIRAVRRVDAKLKMPPEKQLTEQQIADLTRWIADGAAWPPVRVPVSVGKPNPTYDRLRAEHWAWQALRNASLPTVKDAAWTRDDIDRFILARLEARGLQPVTDADRVSLIRRLTFDLTGLPPAPEEIDAFLADTSADAVARVVDRLLASPAFGEHWGRHWLDVARYGESTGSARNLPYPQAWRYRDYVINAFNTDRPYNQFVTEQIAGDLLSASSPKERDEHLIATGFLALGVKDVNQRFKVRYIMDNIDEQIDAVSRGFLALTASCARCHDHKFDPIPQTDYYALAGIFHSTDLCSGLRNKMGGGGLDYFDPSMLIRLSVEKPAPPAKQVAELKKQFEKAKAEWDTIRGTPEGLAKGTDGQPKQRPYRLKMEKLQAELAALTDPANRNEVILGVRDSRTIGDTALRVRGEAEKHGPSVPRGFLTVLNVADVAKVNAAQSGRLELARWLTSEKNPLPARVMANRVWHHLFGAGLVASVDNFGTTGEKPSHPELLDHLAARFIREGWSVKKLVRAIVLSRAYQLGSDAPKSNMEVDPGNRLVWRHSPRRHSAEEIRDTILSASGALDRNPPHGSPAMDFKVIELGNNGPQAKKLVEQATESRGRSVYLPLVRGITPTSLEVFDFAEQGMVTGSRDATTVAPQALYLLNDLFVLQQSRRLAARLLARAELDDESRIQMAYRLTLGRSAASREIARAQKYLADHETTARELTKSNPNSNPVEESRSDPHLSAWSSFCQAIYGSAEFRFVR